MTEPTSGRVSSPERVIEVTIGMWDDTAVPRGENPPRLAAAILDDLRSAGYCIVPLVGLTDRASDA
jgi:hypothetical protein